MNLDKLSQQALISNSNSLCIWIINLAIMLSLPFWINSLLALAIIAQGCIEHSEWNTIDLWTLRGKFTKHFLFQHKKKQKKLRLILKLISNNPVYSGTKCTVPWIVIFLANCFYVNQAHSRSQLLYYLLRKAGGKQIFCLKEMAQWSFGI